MESRTLKVGFAYSDMIALVIGSGTPSLWREFSRASWDIVSKALAQSRKTRCAVSPCLSNNSRTLRSMCTGCEVERFLRNPYWCGRSLSSSPALNLIWRSDAYSLYAACVREMGRVEEGRAGSD